MSEKRAREARQKYRAAMAKAAADRKAERERALAWWAVLGAIVAGILAGLAALPQKVAALRREVGKLVRAWWRHLLQKLCGILPGGHLMVGIGARVKPDDGFRITRRCGAFVHRVCKRCGAHEFEDVLARAERGVLA